MRAAAAGSRSRDITPTLDDLVVLDLAPVPGSKDGSTVDLPFLTRQGVTSGPAYRAYIAARSLVWRPGKTRRPVPNEDWYGWSGDPNDYPVLTFADLRRLAFGDGDAMHRTKAAIVAPWEHLPDVVIVPGAIDARTGARGYRVLPAEAEHAVRKARDGAAPT